MSSKSKIPKSSAIPISTKSRVGTTNKTAITGTSSKKSSASKNSKSTSPEVKTILKAIDELGTDMKGELLNKLMSYNRSNASARNLPLVNKEFADSYTYTRNLTKIKSAQKSLFKDLPEDIIPQVTTSYVQLFFKENLPEFSTKNLSKEIDNVVSIIGNIKLDKLNNFSPIKNELDKIFKNKRKLMDPMFFDDEVDEDGFPKNIEMYAETEEGNKNTFKLMYSLFTLNIMHSNLSNAKKESLKKYMLRNYEQYTKDYIELWNSYNSAPDRLMFLQKQIIKNRELIQKYDPETTEIDKPNIDAFLKLNNNNTYSEYIQAIRNLPMSVKQIIYYKRPNEGEWAEDD